MNLDHLKNPVYENHPLIKWVDDFMLKANLYPQSQEAVLGVSGGKDSMLLLFVFYHLFKKGRFKRIRVIHIDHKLRTDSFKDGALVKKTCAFLNIPCQIFVLDNLNGKNIEHRARKMRYGIFQKNSSCKDFVYTAHHIDDSFEWSLMSQFKTGSYKNTLGIPLIKGNIARPFMCLTRAQIEQFIFKFNIPFRNDSTNDDVKFERNYIRHNIIKLVHEKFPCALKHYVYRANDLARIYRLSRICLNQSQEFVVKMDSFNGVYIVHPEYKHDFNEVETQMLSIIQKLSQNERGVLRKQLRKLIEANLNYKRGPLIFSGGVKAHLFYGMIYFDHDSIDEEVFAKYDEEIFCSLKGAHIPKISFHQYKKVLTEKIHSENKPVFYAFGLGDRLNRILVGQKRIDRDFKKCQSLALEKHFWFGNPYRLLLKWGEEKNRHHLLNVMIF